MAALTVVLLLMLTASPKAWGALFPTVHTYPVSGNSYSVAIGELTGDTTNDLAAANGGNVTVFPGVAGGDLGPGTDYPVGTRATFVRILDLTGDGRNDLVVADPDAGIVVLPGLLGGGFGPAQTYGTGTNPLAFAIADLNGDAILDIAAVNTTDSILANQVSVMLGLPGGGFGPVSNYPVGPAVALTLESVAIGDLNGDGRKDLAVGQANDSATILYGLAGGGFGLNTVIDTGGVSYVVAVADLDGDTRLDLAAINGAEVVLHYGLPGGGLGARVDYTVPGDLQGLAIGDLNGDGRPDIVTGTFITVPGFIGSVATLLALPSGGFGPPTSYQMGNGTSLVDIGDLDADGRPDIAGAGFDNSTVSVVPGRAGGGFLGATYYGGGATHFGIALGDLNADVRPDIAVPNGQAPLSNQASVLTGVPGDGFTAASFGAAKVARSIATGDVDADGILDLVLVNSGAAPSTDPGTASVLLGLPGGGYGANIDYAVGVNPLGVKLSDLNGDGRLDIVAANFGTNDVSVLMQAGGGFAPEARYFSGAGATGVGVGDFNADGLPDLAVLNATARTVSGLLGLAGGGFGAPTSYPTPTLPGTSIAIADMNSDGNLDLAIASRISGTPGTIGRASVFLGLGGGAFAPRTDYLAGVGANNVAAGDLDGDGILDLAVGCPTGNVVAVLLGLPGGGFGASTTYGAIAPRAVAIGDMDEDGRPDLGIAGLGLAGVAPNLGPALAVNHAPAITASPDLTVPAGTPVHFMATAIDPDALQKLTITSTVSPPAPWLLHSGGVSAALPVVTASRSGTPGAANGGTYTITWTATDNSTGGATSTAVTVLTVEGATNNAPVVTIASPPSGSVFAVDTPVSFTGSFTDDAGDTHTATWFFDALSTPGTVNEASGAVSATYTFSAAGVYNVSLQVTDNGGASDTATTVSEFSAMIVIYDPSAGFVTGGGWINSPPGAYPANPNLIGKANLGFVSKYKKGALIPTGETEFRFSVADLSFHSGAYEWLVIAGAKAQYKGSGTINGTGDYRFMLTAIDGQTSGGGGVDKIRMKIWDNSTGGIVYDNQLGASDAANPVTTLGGGSIVIQKTGGSAAGDSPSEELAGSTPFVLLPNSPNPFNPETSIAYQIGERSQVRVQVFDIRGRLITTLVNSVQEPGRHASTWNGRTSTGAAVASGKYLVRLEAGRYQATRAIVLMK